MQELSGHGYGEGGRGVLNSRIKEFFSRWMEFLLIFWRHQAGRNWASPVFSIDRRLAWIMHYHRPDEVARIRALSNGSIGQRSFESALVHFGAKA